MSYVQFDGKGEFLRHVSFIAATLQQVGLVV